MNRNYLACYRVLEVEPGCSWTQLRGAYRRLVRIWHPDRLHQQPEKKVLAEEKIKEITHSYQILAGYYERYGKLPVAGCEMEGRPASETAARCPPQERRWSQAPVTVLTEPDWASDRPLAPAAKSVRLGRLAVIGLVAWAAYVFWWPEPTTTVSAAHQRRALSQARSAEKRVVPDSSWSPVERGDFFTVGSTRDQVQAVQGLPDDIRNGAWYYGKSRVYFANGTVQRWVNDPSDPLRVAFGAPRFRHRPAVFAVGSTKADVRSIQGLPLLETAHEWNYGASKVYFTDGRVSGWYSSPFAPLKVGK